MCCSALGQIVFGILMTVCLGLTVASMFSDGWREFKKDVSNGDVPDSQGIFQFSCKMPGASSGGASNVNFCENWWKDLKTWEKVVVAAMCLALATEIIALAWNVFSCFACCCKKYVIHPLTLFAMLVAIFLAVAVIVYGINNSDATKDFEKWVENGSKPTSQVGYSFYLACGALVCSLASIIIASLTVWFADKCL